MNKKYTFEDFEKDLDNGYKIFYKFFLTTTF